MLIVTCPNCDQRIEADESFAGTVAKCPSCDGDVNIPSDREVAKNTPMMKINQNKNTILSIAALVIAILALLMQFGIFPRSNLDFETPEDAIKSVAELHQSGSFMDYRRMDKLFREEDDWESVSPNNIEIVKTLEVKGTGNDDYDGGALCFLKFKKGDGVESHEVVFLKKSKKGLFNSAYISSAIKDEYGSIIRSWEKNGTLK